MKILLASDTWSPMVNGVVRSVELLYHQLLALGHDVWVVFFVLFESFKFL